MSDVPCTSISYCTDPPGAMSTTRPLPVRASVISARLLISILESVPKPPDVSFILRTFEFSISESVTIASLAYPAPLFSTVTVKVVFPSATFAVLVMDKLGYFGPVVAEAEVSPSIVAVFLKLP